MQNLEQMLQFELPLYVFLSLKMLLKRQKVSKIFFTQKKLSKFKALSWQAVGLFIFAQSNHKLFSPINLSYLGLIHMRHFYTQY